jgi:hypothetical protein
LQEDIFPNRANVRDATIKPGGADFVVGMGESRENATWRDAQRLPREKVCVASMGRATFERFAVTKDAIG